MLLWPQILCFLHLSICHLISYSPGTTSEGRVVKVCMLISGSHWLMGAWLAETLRGWVWLITVRWDGGLEVHGKVSQRARDTSWKGVSPVTIVLRSYHCRFLFVFAEKHFMYAFSQDLMDRYLLCKALCSVHTMASPSSPLTSRWRGDVHKDNWNTW